MTTGRCEKLAELPEPIRGILDGARRAVLSTIDARGHPHAVPIVYAVHGADLVSPIDRKPKSGRILGRRLNIERDPSATLLADRWSEEWTRLAWVMVRGRAAVEPAEGSVEALEAIIARYPVYRDTIEASEVIRLVPDRISWWSWT